MALESLTGGSVYLSALVVTNPPDSDDPIEGAAHLRGIKNVIKNTLPNINAAVAASDEHLNMLAAMTVADWSATTSLTLPAASGTSDFRAGTGDGADYTTHNVNLKLHWGLGIVAYDGVCRGVYNARSGTWDVKDGFYRDGLRVDSIGSNQTWQDLTASRARTTNFTNMSGRPIQVSIKTGYTIGVPASLTVGGLVIQTLESGIGFLFGTLTAIIPPGAVYRIDAGYDPAIWAELR